MILNGKVFNPGELRIGVLLAPRSVSTETGGFRAAVPDTARQVSARARWIGAHGPDVWAANASGAVEPATVTIRYRPGFDATWLISKDNGSTWFEVIGAPDNILQRNEYFEFKVSRVGGG